MKKHSSIMHTTMNNDHIFNYFCYCRSALEYCQESATILEQLSDSLADTDGNSQLSAVQDRVAAAYLWQALLEHEAAMEEKQAVESPQLSESCEAEEV